jgi:hypothetical protein
MRIEKERKFYKIELEANNGLVSELSLQIKNSAQSLQLLLFNFNIHFLL